jgi:hypothetical protein
MNHLPFEAQIIDNHPMDEPQQQALKVHLVECVQCRTLQTKWLMVESQLRSVPMVTPAPGFHQRWQASLSLRHAREQRHKAVRFLCILLGANLISLIVILVSTLLTGSAVQWLVSTINTITGLFQFWSQIEEVAYAVLQLLPPVAPIILMVLSACGLCLAIAFWVISLWRISFQGVNVK